MASVSRDSYDYARQPEDAVKFKDYVTFDSFLKVLLRYCSDKLAEFRTPEEMKTLANDPVIVPYKDLLMDDHFAARWRALTLCAKCPVTNRRYTGSMKDEANNIKLALAKQGSLLKCFGDFPTYPEENLVDLRRFYHKLLDLQQNGTRKYTVNQRSYISHSLTMLKGQLNTMNNEERIQCLRDASPKRNADQAFGESDNNEAAKTKTPDDDRPSEKRANVELPNIEAEKDPKSAKTNSSPMKAVDFFIVANPQLSKENAFEQFSYLESDVRAYFDNFEKNQAALCHELVKRGQNC